MKQTYDNYSIYQVLARKAHAAFIDGSEYMDRFAQRGSLDKIAREEFSRAKTSLTNSVRTFDDAAGLFGNEHQALFRSAQGCYNTALLYIRMAEMAKNADYQKVDEIVDKAYQSALYRLGQCTIRCEVIRRSLDPGLFPIEFGKIALLEASAYHTIISNGNFRELNRYQGLEKDFNLLIELALNFLNPTPATRLYGAGSSQAEAAFYLYTVAQRLKRSNVRSRKSPRNSKGAVIKKSKITEQFPLFRFSQL